VLTPTLKMIRKEKRLTQQTVAEKAGIPRSTYSNIELGLKDTTAKKARKIADALGITLDEFSNALNASVSSTNDSMTGTENN